MNTVHITRSMRIGHEKDPVLEYIRLNIMTLADHGILYSNDVAFAWVAEQFDLFDCIISLDLGTDERIDL